jgi:hypothetical protein
LEAAGVKLDADGAYRVNDVGVGIAFITTRGEPASN